MRTLLMMEGDRVFLRAVERIAPSLGFAVFTAGTKTEFQALYRRHSPEAILIGIVVPEVDGSKIAAWLCAEGATARLLLVSAHNPLYAKWLKHLVETNGGMSVEVLHKPIDRTQLVAALEGQGRPQVPRTLQEGSNGNDGTIPPRNL